MAARLRANMTSMLDIQSFRYRENALVEDEPLDPSWTILYMSTDIPNHDRFAMVHATVCRLMGDCVSVEIQLSDLAAAD